MNGLPNDIKGLVEVPDFSIYYLIGIASTLLILLTMLGVYLYRRFNSAEKRERESNLETLNSIDWSDSRESAYLVTEIGRKVASTDRSRAILDEVIEMLEPFKYRKSVNDIPEEIKVKFHLFCQVVENE